MEKDSLKQYLSGRYQGWDSFCATVIFPIFGKEDYDDRRKKEVLDMRPERRLLADATGIRSVKFCGQTYVSGEPFQFFDITVADKVMMERNRVNVQKIIRSVMDQYSSAFMIFHYDDEERWEWRFSFCYKSANEEESTDRKRYTFLLGPGQSCRTAAENFLTLYNKHQKDEEIEIDDIIQAFNVEALSKEFFDGYKKIYEDIIQYVTGKRMVKVNNKWEEQVKNEPCNEIMQEFKSFSNPEKAVRDYVKKLMGRIVFLQFLQKKGWLGVPVNEKWGKGSQSFIQDLFDKSNDKDHFIDNVLEPLFNDLNTERANDLVSSEVGSNIRIPYLNGGLFERDAADETKFPLPCDYMKSLLEFFSWYNFTIDENDPDDAEVGVDPEMLGRIFENLLEDNKDKGAFYTPKEIVSYMCRESLIAYLQTGIEDEATKEAIRQFVTTHDVKALGTNDKFRQQVDEALKNVKICDPAIGSGAFPMGLLKELFQCRTALEGISQHQAAEIKKHIIQQNIYGVDIERGAVDIARLRFWLSLIVDEETPQALPNLDFKIMQGNSLLEQYKGVDLSTMTEKKADESGMLSIFDSMLDVYRKELRDMLSKYYDCTDHKEKQSLRKEIVVNVKKQLTEQSINVDFGDLDLSGNNQFMLWHTWFYDVFAKGGFDIVIGNPPWGADMSKESKSLLKTLYPEIDSSTPNSYAYFIGWGLKNYMHSLMFVLPDSILIKDFKRTRELISSNVREVLWYQNCSVPRDKRVFRDVEHDVCIVCLDKANHSHAHFQTNNYEGGCYVPKDIVVAKSVVLKKEFDYVFNLKASATDWEIASKLLIHQPLSSLAQCHEGIHSGNVRDKLFIMGYKQNLKPMYYGGKAGDIIRPYVSYMNGWYVDYRSSIIDQDAGEYASLRDERLFALPKIYITRTGNPFKAFYDENSYASNNFFSLQTKDYKDNNKDNLLFLLPFINSKVCQFFIRKFAAPRLGDSFIETKIIHLLKFPIPQTIQSDKSKLIELVAGVIKAKSANQHADTSILESEIDKKVYQLYGLTDEEIKIVEQSK